MNIQPVEPQVKGNGDELDLHSLFFTIQGEGPYTGHRAIFVRLAGCNLQCPWCDTEYTQGRQVLDIKEILIKVMDLGRNNNAMGCLVVITGGEPLRQPIGRFVKALRDFNFRVQIESNGVFAPDRELQNSLEYDKQGVMLIVSPKTRRIHKDCARYAYAYKYVLDHRSIDLEDHLPKRALNHPNPSYVARPTTADAIVYVSPCDTGNKEHDWINLQTCAAAAMAYGYICGIQLHKIIDLP